jgi:hypothetical protein
MPAIVANAPTSAIPTREPDFVLDHWLVLRGLWSHVGRGIRVVRKHEPD